MEDMVCVIKKEDKFILINDLEIFQDKIVFVESLDIENNDKSVEFEVYFINFSDESDNICVGFEY